MKILHLYAGYMNLYGEYGNVSLLSRSFGGAEVTLTDTAENIDFEAYDFIYCGSGTEKNLLVCCDDMVKYGGMFNKAVQNGICALFTGNSYEMLGQSIEDAGGEKHAGAGLFGFHSVQTGARETSDVIYNSDIFVNKTVGFVNRGSVIHNIEKPLFTVDFGIGAQDEKDGAYINNLLCMSVIGPVMARNPHILNLFCESISKKTGEKFNIEPLVLKIYENILKNLEARKASDK